MAEGVMNLFKMMIIVQLFYSFAITTITHTLPEQTLTDSYVSSFHGSTDSINVGQISSEIETALTRQTNLPIIDVGALIFYSGNILIDLIFNFLFALPEMLFLIINGIAGILQIPYFFQHELQAFATAFTLIIYIIGIIQLFTGLMAGRSVT